MSSVTDYSCPDQSDRVVTPEGIAVVERLRTRKMTVSDIAEHLDIS